MLDTIAAISASGGSNAISIIRICGADAFKIASRISSCKDRPRYAQLCNIVGYDGQFIDTAIVIYFKAPNSFNGEDIVEIQSHGGKTVAGIILRNILSFGARMAEPGEFTKIAVLNQKIDITKAEAIGALINSTNEKSAKILAKQLQGSLLGFVSKNRDNLLDILAHCEVNIDYAEEDLPVNIVDQISAKLNSTILELTITNNASLRRRSLFTGLKIGIIGKPNVGKSSMLNSLLEYDRAIVSDIAGTTRDTIEEILNIGEYRVKLVDTAGIRNSTDAIENIGIQYSLKVFDESDIVLALFDGSREFAAEDQAILDLLESNSNKIILVVVTKSDLCDKFDFSKLAKYKMIRFSTKFGCDELENHLNRVLDSKFDSDESEYVLINERQIEACRRALEASKMALQFLSNESLELFAFYIKESIEHFTTISECYDNEEMLSKMFSGFCVGK